MSEARKNAGDPGPVLARRLSNAEYNNTIRDLTGVDIRPAREFPVDPANTDGFDNSGESLAMSPALFNKYLQAAREVSEHMVLKPDGFDFAPHPMLVETDRDRYAIQRILDFYARQPTDYASYFEAAWRYKHRAALGKPHGARWPTSRRRRRSARSICRSIWNDPGGTDRAGHSPKSGRWPSCRRCGARLPAPASNPAGGAAREVRRDARFRRSASAATRRCSSPRRSCAGLPAGSQPLLNWKLRQFNLHRREFDPQGAAQRHRSRRRRCRHIPRYPGLHQEAAPALGGADGAAPARATRIWSCPPPSAPAMKPPSRASPPCSRTSSTSRERGRYFPDDSDDKGRFLSAGYHNVMGYWRDDIPLMELILDEKGQKELDRLWDEFDFIADHTARTWDQFYFNQSGAVDGKGRRSRAAAPRRQGGRRPGRHLRAAGRLPARRPRPIRATIRSRSRRSAITSSGSTTRCAAWRRMRLDAEPRHLDAAAPVCRARLPPAARRSRTRGIADLLSHACASKDGLTHEEAIRDLIVSVLMSPKFCYRLDLGCDGRPGKRASRPQPGYQPLSGYALASRLSYFLWSSMPDDELLDAPAGDLQKTEVLIAQARAHAEGSARPRAWRSSLAATGSTSAASRSTTRSIANASRPSPTNCARRCSRSRSAFIEDVIRNDRSVLDLLYGNYTFVNPVLAKHYGMPESPAATESLGARRRCRPIRTRRPADDGRVPDAECARACEPVR